MIISADPSINNTGFAVFSTTGHLVSYGMIRPDEGCKTWVERAHSIAIKVAVLHLRYKEVLTDFVYEMPEVWYEGKGLAAKSSGALEKLFFVTGMLHVAMQDYNPVGVPPRKWKGQVTKAVTIAAMQKLHNIVGLLDHEADAIGIGHYFLDTIKAGREFVL